MSVNDIPEAVKALIAERIDSVSELEAVLLLRESRGREWSEAEAGERLYVSKTVAAHVLGVLTERGFLVFHDGKYRYEPCSVELDQVVAQVAREYSKHLVALTRLIHSKPPASVRQFAEAFRLRKDK